MFETELKTERACFQYILVKILPSNEDLIPGLERCPGVENDNPLQYSCWENLMDRGQQATTYGVTKESHVTSYLNNKNQMQLSIYI